MTFVLTVHRLLAASVLLATIGLTGCGTQVAKTPVAASQPVLTHQSLSFGPITLATGMVWQLNNPGGGTPRELLTIEGLKGHHVVATVYVSEFGSLIQANLKGTVYQGQPLKLSGAVAEASVTGTSHRLPMQLIIQAKNRHTIWVTQSIQGDTANTFSQISFHDNVQ